ncbi:hypothetical protein LTR17_025690 [Elasticomyces elasticus]|nr:hypothetical protein LTR17_025690 [Elasticomyces elasticus]
MSGPSPIANRYKRYKAGTKKLTRWLYVKGSCDSTAAKSTETKNLSTQDLVRLADGIVSTTPHVDIPLEIIVVTEDVISGRQVCADWYASTSSDPSSVTEKRNKGHLNFIAVLKNILSILQRAYEGRCIKAAHKPKRGAVAATKTDIIQNIFDYLDVEEPTATPLGAGSKSARPSRAAGCPEINIPEVDDADEAFAIWCLFKDQYDVCQYIKSIWEQHVAGKTSFRTVCEVTDSAFTLMQKASDEFTSEYPHFSHMQDINDFLGFETSVSGQTVTVLGFRNQRLGASAHTIPAVHELFCTRAYNMLQEFKGLELGEPIPPGAYNRSHRFAAVLRALVPEVLLMYRAEKAGEMLGTPCSTNDFHRDIFVAALVRSGSTGAMAPSLATICQAYMHIYDALGPCVAEGFTTLHQDLDRLRQARLGRRAFVGLLGEGSPLPMANVEVMDGAGIERYVEKDAMVSIQAHSPWEDLRKPSAPFQTQKLLPVSCGAMLWIQQLSMHTSGLTMCNAGFAVVAAAHLYKAARRSGVLQTAWEDMDWFIAQHGAAKPVVLEQQGNTTSLDALARHYRISLGGRLPKKKEKSSGPPDAKLYTRVSGVRHRFQYAELPSPLQSLKNGRIFNEIDTSPHLRNINSSWKAGTASWDNLLERSLYEVANAALDRQAAGVGIDRSKSRGARSWKLSAVQLLESFADMLKEDELNFNLDYMSFSRDCFDLLSTMAHTYVPLKAGDIFIPSEFVNIMLWEVTGTEKKGKDAIKLEDTMMFEMKDYLQQHVRTKGSHYLEEARPRCSSHMERPSALSDYHVVKILGPPDPFTPLQGIGAVKEHYKQQGVEFHLDETTNTVLLYNPAWKTAFDSRRDLLRWFGVNDQELIEASMTQADYHYWAETPRGRSVQEAGKEAYSWSKMLESTQKMYLKQLEIRSMEEKMERDLAKLAELMMLH